MTQITNETIQAIRERHEWLRGFRDESDAEWETDNQLDEKVAQEFSVAVTYVRGLVLGRIRPQAGGPLDNARIARTALYHEEAATLGEKEARRRRQLRSRNIDPTPKTVRYTQRVTILNAKGQPTAGVVDLQPGETVKVELIAVGGES